MRWRRLLVWTGLSLALLLVFASYLHPDLALTLANELWNCF